MEAHCLGFSMVMLFWGEENAHCCYSFMDLSHAYLEYSQLILGMLYI